VKPKLTEARDALSRLAGRSIASDPASAESRLRVLDWVPARKRRLLLRPVVQAALGAVAIAWLTWPVETLIPETGLDPSWRAGLSMASLQSLEFGKELTFSYGPLGYLAYPYLYFPVTAALAGLYVGVLQAAIAGSLLWAARASFGFFGAAAIALAISKMAILVLPTSLLVPPLAFLWCAYAIRRSSDRWFLAVALGGGLIGALELLIRVTSGLIVLALVGVTLVMERERRSRNLAVFAASGLTSFLVLWLASGQDIRSVPDYLLYSFEIVSGYSDAMAYEDPSLKWEYFAAAAAAAVVLFIGWRNTEGWSRPRRLKLLALGAVLAYPTFKQQFVRHDEFHTGPWFISAAVVLVALSWRRDTRGETALGLVCVLMALGAGRVTLDELNPFRSAGRAVDQLRTMATSERLAVSVETRDGMRSHYRLDERILARIRNRTVHVYGDETSVAWAYPEFRWHPLPAFQSYTAYTKRLDELNARFLWNDGPEFVLRGPDAPVDSRNFTLEAPETMLRMFCRYEEVLAVPGWQLLQRRANRCGTPRKLGTVQTRVGEHLAVPHGSGRGMILMDLRESPTSAWQRLRSLIFRRKGLYAIVNDAAIFRMVPGTATGPMIVRIPDALDYPGNPLSVDAEKMALVEDRGGGGTPGVPLTVDFHEVPVGSASAGIR
jgi:hypothetical protein